MSHACTGPRKKKRHRKRNKKKLPQKPLPAPTHDNDSFTVTPQGPSAAATGDACSAMKRHALAADEKTQQVTESNLHKFRTAANAALADLETDIVDLEIKKKKALAELKKATDNEILAYDQAKKCHERYRVYLYMEQNTPPYLQKEHTKWFEKCINNIRDGKKATTGDPSALLQSLVEHAQKIAEEAIKQEDAAEMKKGEPDPSPDELIFEEFKNFFYMEKSLSTCDGCFNYRNVKAEMRPGDHFKSNNAVFYYQNKDDQHYASLNRKFITCPAIAITDRLNCLCTIGHIIPRHTISFSLLYGMNKNYVQNYYYPDTATTCAHKKQILTCNMVQNSAVRGQVSWEHDKKNKKAPGSWCLKSSQLLDDQKKEPIIFKIFWICFDCFECFNNK